MKKKQEEQARQMKELQGHAKHLQRDNDQLRAHIKKSRNLGKNVQNSGRTVHPIARNREKEPIIRDDIDTPTDDKLSLGSSSSLSLSLAKNAREGTKVKSCKKPSHHPAFNDAISGASRRVRREAYRRQNQPNQAPRNVSVFPASTMPPIPLLHPTFDTGPTFYMP